jgi:hypothetical protein
LVRLANRKALRIISLGFFLFLLAWVSTPAYAVQAMALITCADSNNQQITRQVGWENENGYFQDKGNIAAHYCEGGYAGSFTTFVSVSSIDGGELDSTLLYFAGILPSPAPTDSISSEVSREDSVQVERTEDVQRTEEVVRTEEVERPVEVAPPAPEPTVEPTPEPTVEATPEPKPTKEPKPEPSPEPTIEPTVEPTIEPTLEPAPEIIPPVEPLPVEEEELPVLSIGKLVENLRNIGSDMTPEVREQAQQVVIASIIVSQIAITAIGRKP